MTAKQLPLRMVMCFYALFYFMFVFPVRVLQTRVIRRPFCSGFGGIVVLGSGPVYCVLMRVNNGGLHCQEMRRYKVLAQLDEFWIFAIQ